MRDDSGNHLEKSMYVRRESERRAAKRLVIVAVAVPRDPRGAEHPARGSQRAGGRLFEVA